MTVRTKRAGKAGLILAAIAALFAALALTVPSASAASDTVTVAGQTHAVNGTNIYRATDYLVRYTPAQGATTGTNQYGYEAAVINGVVTTAQDGVGNMAIPSNGYVLSGHGTSRTWLKTYAKVGATVVYNPDGGPTSPPPTSSSPPPGGQKLTPDLGVRVLRQFTIQNVNGVKELKFPIVTANVGKGPFELNASRSSSTSTDWVVKQRIYTASGGPTDVVVPVTLVWGGDGHNHWHVKDIDKFVLRDKGNTQDLRYGEKHGFCFEDNTSYRDWPQNGTNGAPRNPVYVPPKACSVNQQSTLTTQHGLSVGWSDTYPSTLPDQYIDVTGLPDGQYRLNATADADNKFQETNEGNNTASAVIQITGNTVTLISTTGGL